MLPGRGLWPGFGQGSALGLMCFSGSVVPVYVFGDRERKLKQNVNNC